MVIISWDSPSFFENLDKNSNLHICQVQINVFGLAALFCQFLECHINLKFKINSVNDMHLPFLSLVGLFSACLKCQTKASRFSYTDETKQKLHTTHRMLKILPIFRTFPAVLQ